MARIPEPPSSCTFPMGGAIFRLSLAVGLALAVFFAARPPAQAAEPDPWFGRDKVMHLTVSFALAGTSYATAAGCTKRTGVRILSGAGVAFSAGIAKELYDQYRGRGFSGRDMTWDAIGTTTGTLVAWLVDRYLL